MHWAWLPSLCGAGQRGASPPPDFNDPDGVALASDGLRYVLDIDNGALCKVSPAGAVAALGTVPTGVQASGAGTQPAPP